MRRIAWCATLLVAITVGRCQGLVAQTVPVPSTPERAAAPAPPAEVEAPRQTDRWRQVLRVGQDYTLRSGDAVREVVVVFGDALIEGLVDQNVVVVFGRAQLASTASVNGALIVVGGSATAASGAALRSDLVVIGGGFDGAPGFSPRGHHIVVGPSMLGGQLDAVVPWLTRGLLWGRLIVPGLPWVWAVVGIFFLVYLALNLVFDGPVRACAATLAGKPLTAFLVGLLVLLLTGPVCLLLAVSIVGIAVVPFVIAALLIAGIIGKVAVARWIGMRVAAEASSDSRLQSIRSFVIGFAVICVAYMVPVLGFLAWTLLGVLGLGGAALAFTAGYRRENPVSPRRGTAGTGPAALPGESSLGDVQVASAAATEPPGIDGRSSAPFAPSVPVAPASDLTAFPRAAFLDRLAAFVLDIILVLIAQQLFDLTRRDSAIFLLLLAYHIGFWTWKGTTVGGIICQLRVVRVDGAPLRFVDALVRGLSAIFSLAVLAIGALWILRDPERQAWHDKIAGTYVVRVPRNYPL
jgi:uncharacterized RDD family membrane protein YckC